ncbi:thioredoxin-like protein [Hortaea werneckii]|uniref:Thioredoxin domain-containing protein n=2 Tax=Hortaea werneckii TaxID=91943 RepID=A0A3M7IAA6_HORWE|nr:thioredoxin-like protein [Hortaea werneckii]OTA32311.1 hypothetical protein BTJ68_07627 [Hortaea werneckii EXF-2000]KAI6807739.1 thioredoxin-like protein [Hortaea werneckii]KAI6808242.1 thioredoxin-like protein [Hortaea werneckii]KAI6814404.1 thioredoxin-like protein [Hortaea werneckii]
MAARLDPTVATVFDRHPANDSDDEDALIAELEQEEDENDALTTHREKRLEQLHAEFARAKMMKTSSHGSHQEIKDEKQLMDITTSTKLCVVHFSHREFHRCAVMDEKLRVLAEKHFDTRFVSINVDNAPFLVVKLGIKVLPCVLAFKDGVSVDRIVGFEGVGYKPDSITASELEARLLSSGVVVRAKMTETDDRRRAKVVDRDEEGGLDDDWD